MAKKQNCIHVGFSYKPEGLHGKRVIVCCDYTGETHDQDRCKTCENYKSKGDIIWKNTSAEKTLSKS